MTYTPEYKRAVLDNARATVKRVDTNLAERPEAQVIYRSDDPVERWRREADEQARRHARETNRRNAEQECEVAMMHRIAHLESGLRDGLRAVNVLGDAIGKAYDRMQAKVDALNSKLTVAEARIADLQRALDNRAGLVPQAIEDIPKGFLMRN